MAIPPEQLRRQAQEDAASALTEDLGDGDRSAAVAEPGSRATATVICRDQGVLCGRLWFEAVFLQLDPQMHFAWRLEEGQEMSAGGEVVHLKGQTRALLSGERTALNFLQTLSGTATAARRLCEDVGKAAPTLLDTRKTLPLLRLAQKHATAVGGMSNHRLGLWDAAMLKENHIAAAGGLKRAVARLREAHPDVRLIVEVRTLAEVREALQIGVEHLLLDNFSPADIAEAVKRVAGRAYIEVSGGMEAEQIRSLTGTGADAVSLGAVTKNLKVPDLSMQLTPEKP